MSVKLAQVIDPAQPGQHGPVPAFGQRFVAAVLTITNNSASTLSENADIEASMIGSNNQTYNAYLAPVSDCPSFNYGQVQLAPGESATGCVVFPVPTGVRVVRVKYGGYAGQDAVGVWLNP
jgi:uncharacterized protein DUF4352